MLIARAPVGVALAALAAPAFAAGPPDAPEAQAAPAAEALFEASDRWVLERADLLRQVNHAIWSDAEVGLAETRSAETLASFLEKNGFTLRRGVAGMPTAFVAESGSGRPIVGILAEYDALPGTSQKAVPHREPLVEGAAGHACGHSIYGTASTAAACAAAAVLRERGLPGTVRLYGTPAEETGIGKLYMARAGLFDDLDAALHWHANDETRVVYARSKAVISLKVRFEGLAAHASRSPEAGRSALDAVELMDVGANYLREHLKEDARIHYVITDGGGQPNVVPPTAEVWYYLRADTHAYVEEILSRVLDIARGAELMTHTTAHPRFDSDSFELLPNRELSVLLQRHLERVGPPRFDQADTAFAREMRAGSLPDATGEPLATMIEPLCDEPYRIPASTDVGNVSWIVPTSGINVASYVRGAPGHSWQIVACTGMAIGEKGMLVAARTLASATLELCTDPEIAARAKAELEQRLADEPHPQSVLPPDQTAPAAIR
jgi:aminobenzoyl-glutamate utilization protein B